jgi:hypothetical protein
LTIKERNGRGRMRWEDGVVDESTSCVADMTKLNLSAIVAGEHLVLGFVLVTVPDLFFNPVDDIFKTISPVRKTALESDHLYPKTSIVTNLIGAGLIMFAV